MSDESQTASEKIDRTAFSVASSFADADHDDTIYWWDRTPTERLRQLHNLRELNYGSAATGRLQRILEVTKKA